MSIYSSEDEDDDDQNLPQLTGQYGTNRGASGSDLGSGRSTPSAGVGGPGAFGYRQGATGIGARGGPGGFGGAHGILGQLMGGTYGGGMGFGGGMGMGGYGFGNRGPADPRCVSNLFVSVNRLGDRCDCNGFIAVLSVHSTNTLRRTQ